MLAPVSGGQRRSSLRPSGSRRNLALAANNGFLAEDSSAMSNFNFNDLPSKLALRVFSYLSHKDLCLICQVCSRWRELAYDTRLWKNVRLRPEYGGLSVSNVNQFIELIGCRFSTGLRSIELPCELIIVPVLEELARQCVNLRCMTLDFSKAMQLHDYTDLVDFPANLENLCVCLSDVIFMEGLMRKIYHCLSSVQVLHLIGTFEQSTEEEEEIYEVINLSKIKSHTPNLRVVNLYGVMFVDDTHVELLSYNCVIWMTGASLKVLLEKCKKIKTLLLHHCDLKDEHMMAVDWAATHVTELDITSTELSSACLDNVLGRIVSFQYLAVGYCDFFTD
uniref:F-box domain-containing protein n=1 Tax=Macrostomum lignano TaxID=282301 RepID=A0A1I8GI14_9PLAT